MQSSEATTIAHLIRIFAEQRLLAQRALEAALLSQDVVDAAVARLTIKRLMAESTALQLRAEYNVPVSRLLH